MTITLRLFGELRRYLPEGSTGRSARIELPEGTTLLQLIQRLGIPYGDHEGPIVAAVNDTEAEHGRVLRDGDTVSLFEPLAGG